MIRHPNYTGMQMDQLTREFTPAKIRAGNGGEARRRAHLQDGRGHFNFGKPHFRFTFAPGDDDIVEVTAKDTDGKVFSANLRGQGLLSTSLVR